MNWKRAQKSDSNLPACTCNMNLFYKALELVHNMLHIGTVSVSQDDKTRVSTILLWCQDHKLVKSLKCKKITGNESCNSTLCTLPTRQ